jgi:hypothetical protein
MISFKKIKKYIFEFQQIQKKPRIANDVSHKTCKISISKTLYSELHKNNKSLNLSSIFSNLQNIANVFSGVDELNSSFESFGFCFAGRSANTFAHECARFACDLEVSPVFF